MRQPETGPAATGAREQPASTRPYVRDEVLRPYRFTGGPWAGRTVDRPRAFTGPDHCMPAHDQIVGGGTWAAADAWPGRNRYAPDGTDGDVVLMTWRLPTGGELADAKVRREIRDEEKRQEFALDAAADAAADAATDGA